MKLAEISGPVPARSCNEMPPSKGEPGELLGLMERANPTISSMPPKPCADVAASGTSETFGIIVPVNWPCAFT